MSSSKWQRSGLAALWSIIVFGILLGSYPSATLLGCAKAIVGTGIVFGLGIEILNNFVDNGKKFYSGGKKKAPLNIVVGTIVFAAICGFALPFVGRISFFNIGVATGLTLALAGFYVAIPTRFSLIPVSYKWWFIDFGAWGWIQLQFILAVALLILGHGWLWTLI